MFREQENTLQQYIERYVEQCNTSVTLTRQYSTNTPNVNHTDNQDIQSAFKVWLEKYYQYNCKIHDCSSYRQLIVDHSMESIACVIGNCKNQTEFNQILLCYNDSLLATTDNTLYDIYENESNEQYNPVTTEVPPETTSYILEQGRCECLC
ncbi:unnamed protein product [Schistosoma turkestanicum]|nr:unnamed protein product [Schistosoma turkestanicum]